MSTVKSVLNNKNYLKKLDQGTTLINQSSTVNNPSTHSSLCPFILSASPPTNTRTLHLAQRFLRVNR